MNPPQARSCGACGAAFYVPARPWTAEEARDIARVRRGFLLAAVGIVLAASLDLGSAGAFLAMSMGPALGGVSIAGGLVGAAGLVLLLGGGALVFLGRRPFEYTMGGKAALALLLLAAGSLLALAATLLLLGRAAAFRAAADPLGLAWTFKSALLWGFLSPALAALGALLLGYDLQDVRGLRLGFAGVLAFAVAGIAGTAVGWAWIDVVSANPFAPSFLGSLGPALLPQRVLDLVWRVVFAFLFYRTSRRIGGGEVPVPPESSGAAPAPV